MFQPNRRGQRPMKICFVTTNFPRYLGDSEGTFILEAARGLTHHGHQVRVIAQHWPGLPTYEWMDGVEVIRPRYWWPESQEMLRQPGGGLPIIWDKSWLARLQMMPFLLVHTLTTAWYARDCDIIHAQWTLSAGTSWLGQWIHRRPVVMSSLGSDLFTVPGTPVGAWVTRWVLQRSASVIVISQALAQAATQLGRSPDAIIPLGVDTRHFHPVDTTHRDNYIVYVGTLIKRKAPHHLIDAMAQLKAKHPRLRLVIVGAGPERNALENQVAMLSLTEQVTFAGAQGPDRVKQWVQRAKLLVLPSTEEGLGVVLLEALACGTPIVASQVGGIPDVVTPEVGLLTPPGDVPALAHAINTLLSDHSRWLQMSRQARQRAETRYDWRRIATQLIDVYQQCGVK